MPNLALKVFVSDEYYENTPIALLELDQDLIRTALSRIENLTRYKEADDDLFQACYWDSSIDFIELYCDQNSNLCNYLVHNFDNVDKLLLELDTIPDTSVMPDNMHIRTTGAYMRVSKHGISWCDYARNTSIELVTSEISEELLLKYLEK